MIDKIKSVLKDHAILYPKAEDETVIIYDEYACAEVKSLLDDMGFSNSVFIYPTHTESEYEPDYWCAVSWLCDGRIQTYGFNWMSAQRKKLLDKVMYNEY